MSEKITFKIGDIFNTEPRFRDYHISLCEEDGLKTFLVTSVENKSVLYEGTSLVDALASIENLEDDY